MDVKNNKLRVMIHSTDSSQKRAEQMQVWRYDLAEPGGVPTTSNLGANGHGIQQVVFMVGAEWGAGGKGDTTHANAQNPIAIQPRALNPQTVQA